MLCGNEVTSLVCLCGVPAHFSSQARKLVPTCLATPPYCSYFWAWRIDPSTPKPMTLPAKLNSLVSDTPYETYCTVPDYLTEDIGECYLNDDDLHSPMDLPVVTDFLCYLTPVCPPYAMFLLSKSVWLAAEWLSIFDGDKTF